MTDKTQRGVSGVSSDDQTPHTTGCIAELAEHQRRHPANIKDNDRILYIQDKENC